METGSETKPQAQKAPDVLRPGSVDNFIKEAPKMMGELTKQFIDQRNVNQRAKIRLQMKAVLDMISVDTEVAPPPGKDDGKKAESECYAPRRYTGEGRMVDAPDSRQNENILGGTYG